MANKYKLPVATLAMPSPLPPARKVKDFRTLKGRGAQFHFQTTVTINEIQYLQDVISQLIERDIELYDVEPLAKVSLKDDPSDIARRERNKLGISFERQLEWKNSAESFRNCRRTLEDIGIFVYLKKMPLDDCRGFTLFYEREGQPPAVVVNDSESFYEAKTFTLWHEYCHLLLREPGISDQNRSNRVERFCNLFAAEFLMPEELVLRVLGMSARKMRRDWTDAQIRSAARKLKISQQAFALRVQELRVAPSDFYDKWMEAQKGKDGVTKKRGFAVISYPERIVRRLGFNCTRIILDSIRRGILHKAEASEIIGEKPVYFDVIRSLVEHAN